MRSTAWPRVLEDLVDAQDTFVADASHQLRNPMTALRLRLENLESEVGPEGTDDLGAALDEVARLSRIIDGLLALAHAERDGTRPEHPVEIGTLVEERRDAWQPLAEERNVDVESRLPGHRVSALATPDRLAQVLDNLLANALDVSPAGSTITLAVDEQPAWVEVHVVDEGRGLTDAERQHAFDRFWRSSSASGDFGGSGLGLSIVRKLVQADGGEAALGSAPGGGVDAVVRLRRR